MSIEFILPADLKNLLDGIIFLKTLGCYLLQYAFSNKKGDWLFGTDRTRKHVSVAISYMVLFDILSESGVSYSVS